MPQVCLPAGAIDAIRIAQIDECTDLPLPGLTTGYIFNCFRNLELSTNVEEGEETILRNDSGKKCFTHRSCDELTNVGLAFELLNPDYELTHLLTGQSLINDGVENIGWFHTEGLSCSPWLSVELFEQVPDEQCAPGHRYRRIVLPKVRFRPVPSNNREGQMRIVALEGATAAASISAWGEGPFGDSPFDFGDLDPAIQTHIMEFFDSSITDTLEGSCGFTPVAQQVMGLNAMWTGQDELTIDGNPGTDPFCPDPSEVVVELGDGSFVTIPLPDPSVTIVDCNTLTISGWDTHNPTGLPVVGVVVNDALGDPLGDFDAGQGLPTGENRQIPPSTEFMELLFPAINTGNGYIPMGSPGENGCGHLSIWYDCTDDRAMLGFNKKDLYGGDVVRTEIEENDGTLHSNVVVSDEWRTAAMAWSYGSGMTIENASSYGVDWKYIRAYDATDTLICEWRDPVMSWHGGPWLLDQTRCIGGGDPPGGGGGFPTITSVVVNP